MKTNRRCENTAYEDGEQCSSPASEKLHGQYLCSFHAQEIRDEQEARDRVEEAIVAGEARYRQSVLGDEA